MIDNNNIAELILKYLRSELTVDESETLENWLQKSTRNRSFFNDLTESINREIKAYSSFEHDKETQRAIIKEKLGFTKVRKIEPKRKVFIWYAAAAFLVILFTGVYFWFNQTNKNELAKTNKLFHQQNDVAPGGNGAVLTLSDGSVISLDSVGKGAIASQGNTKIISNAGQLAYKFINIKSAHENLMYNTLTTRRANQYQLILPDGSKVWLNAASSIKYPVVFLGNTRNVTITGEAYFEIVHDATRPFTVSITNSAGEHKADVEVLGTHFNINAYEDEPGIKTTLIQGAIRISNTQNKKVLSPGDEAMVNPDNNISIEKNTNTDNAIAWKNGLIALNGDIKNIMRQFSRWYDVDIKYDGPISTEKIYGKIPRNINLSGALEALKINSKLNYSIVGKTILVKQ